MEYWAVMIFSAVFIPAVMILCGYLLTHGADTRLHDWFGFRSKRARMSAEARQFANEYCGKLCKRFGVLLLIASLGAVVVLYFTGADRDTSSMVMMFAQTAAMLLTIVLAEWKLRKTFDDSGNQK